jgi:hypothetical protein
MKAPLWSALSGAVLYDEAFCYRFEFGIPDLPAMQFYGIAQPVRIVHAFVYRDPFCGIRLSSV